MLKAYLPLKIVTGKDQSMLLSILLQDIKEDGIHFQKHKKIKNNVNTKRSIAAFYNQLGEPTGLKEIIDDRLKWHRQQTKIGSMLLFCTSQGQPYIKENGITSAFSSMLGRTMKKALEQDVIQERFTEHDLSAKTASDVETVEQAAKRRRHLNTKTTQKIYR